MFIRSKKDKKYTNTMKQHTTMKMNKLYWMQQHLWFSQTKHWAKEVRYIQGDYFIYIIFKKTGNLIYDIVSYESGYPWLGVVNERGHMRDIWGARISVSWFGRSFHGCRQLVKIHQTTHVLLYVYCISVSFTVSVNYEAKFLLIIYVTIGFLHHRSKK